LASLSSSVLAVRCKPADARHLAREPAVNSLRTSSRRLSDGLFQKVSSPVPVPLGTTVRGRCSPIQQRDRLLAGGEDHHERLQDLSLRAGITL